MSQGLAVRTGAPRPAATPGSPARQPLPARAWADLERRVTGRLHLPGVAGFREQSELFNTRYRHRPQAVLAAADVADVVTGLRWARSAGVPVVAHAGGHSFAGYSVNDGLVVDLARLSTVAVDAGSGLVTVGGGARIGQVYGALRPYEMAFSLGTNPLVGVTGLALGGGAEYISRAFGLTCDALVETTLVTAAGEVLVCNEHENADLFWACRGGGGGNFGINTSMTFQARPVPDVATFSLEWDWEHAHDVLPALQSFTLDGPDELGCRIGVATTGGDVAAARRNASVTAAGQLLGGTAEQVRDMLAPVLAVARPRHQAVDDRTFWAAKGAMVHATAGDQFAFRCNYAKEPVSQDAFEAMTAAVERWPGSTSADGGGASMFAWGGRINTVDPAATAFVHRDTHWLVSMDTAWSDDDDPGAVAANVDWLAGLHADLRPHLSSSSYQNFMDPDLTDWRSAYYGSNYDRLVAVKRQVDPDDVFRFPQGIGSPERTEPEETS